MNTAKNVAALIDQWKASGAEAWRIAWSAALLCVDWPYVFGAWGAECTPAERRRRKRDDHPTIVSKCQVLNGSKSSCAGCRWFPGGETVRCFDCRGFTDWCLKQAGVDLKGEGATSQWNTASNWLRKGEIVTMPENTLVCLFVQKGAKMEHTGFGLNNETCECSVGVQHFTKRNKKWTHWAIPRGLYDGSMIPDPVPSSVPASEAGHPTLRLGSKGDAVRKMQELLLQAGESLPQFGADGDFGGETLAAVRSFQRKHQLEVDGICGKNTWAKLCCPPAGEQGDNPFCSTDAEQNRAVPDVPAPLYTVHVPNLTEQQAEILISRYAGAWKE